MNTLEWAKNEIAIASKRERGNKPENECDYGCACYDSALKAFESLLGDGHGGTSISFTKNILNRLIDRKPLTPIEDTEDMWNYAHDKKDGSKCYQCKRMSSLFKYVAKDGSVSYSDLNRCYCASKEKSSINWFNGFILSIYDEMYPITMPYMPNKNLTS